MRYMAHTQPRSQLQLLQHLLLLFLLLLLLPLPLPLPAPTPSAAPSSFTQTQLELLPTHYSRDAQARAPLMKSFKYKPHSFLHSCVCEWVRLFVCVCLDLKLPQERAKALSRFTVVTFSRERSRGKKPERGECFRHLPQIFTARFY